MSKLYYMNRMGMGASAGDPFLGSLIGKGIKLVGGLFKKKGVQAVVQAAKTPVGKQVIGGVAAGAGWAAGQSLLSAGGGSGASGSWGRRRRRGITALELRGYRKVANLIHKEGMVSRRARGRK